MEINKSLYKEATIAHEGNKWVVYTKDKKKKLGEHKTKEEALAQLRAIEINKHKSGLGGKKVIAVYEDDSETDNIFGKPQIFTRYCPDHPGVMVIRINDLVFQCPVDNKVYEYDKASVANQTPEDAAFYGGAPVGLWRHPSSDRGKTNS